MKNLVIVESPTKARTIEKFLGSDYVIASSYGHVRDLPKGELGVDVENNFKPKYVIPTKARKNLNILKKEAEKADIVILATDEDREGEAIAWHLEETLKANKKKTQRIAFHEITEGAIKEALKNPRDIDINQVNAQQARRILDRLVGYKLSPFLWKKVVKGLSAGRVQSVAVRLIVEREREHDAFKQQEYYTIEALLAKDEPAFIALLHAKDKNPLDKLSIQSQIEADDILNVLNNAVWKVESVSAKETRKAPLPPFTTSTLQQTAGMRFGWPAKRTMMLAQNLYERGHITYHRTDSLNLAESAIFAVREYIERVFGKEYVLPSARAYKTRAKGAQEAHEAIRPTNPENTPERIKLEPAQKKLYTLIWQRLIASQMPNALFDAKTIVIETGTPYIFRATGSTQKFPGFLKIYPMKIEENDLPELARGDELSLKNLEAVQHFTQPPARYNEATLVKALEKYGVGRPSTYASIISTIQDRNYVRKNEQKRLEPNEIGYLVNDLLVEHFPRIVDIEFTAHMEKDLDQIADGKREWHEVLAEFYEPFEKNLEKKYEEVQKASTDEQTDKKCPKCGKPLVKKIGRFGEFLACSGFPECKHTESIGQKEKELGVYCPHCVEGKVITKKTRRGKEFFGCLRWPDCKFATWDKPHIVIPPGSTTPRIEKCPQCERGVLTEKGKKLVCSEKECKYEVKV